MLLHTRYQVRITLGLAIDRPFTRVAYSTVGSTFTFDVVVRTWVGILTWHNTLTLLERRDIWGVGAVYGGTLTYTRFVSIPGEPEMIYMFSGIARANVSIQETFQVRFEPVSCRRRQM